MADVGYKGTIFITVLIVWGYFDIFLVKHSPCCGYSKLLTYSFGDKSIIPGDISGTLAGPDFLLRITMESPDSRVRAGQGPKNASWDFIA